MLAAFTDELDKIAPRYDIHGSQIQVLRTPVEFYETLKSKIAKAKRRVFLSTLYIGKSEHELISTLRTALSNNPDLKLSILTDALRGTREQPHPSCASLLVPLIIEFGPERVAIRMYHTPNLTGLRKKYIPKRINEGWGLQHMKLYGMDDEIIISGANLSGDYFTNRQDRYHVFSSAQITECFWEIHAQVSKVSFEVVPTPPAKDAEVGVAPAFKLEWPSENLAENPLLNAPGGKFSLKTAKNPIAELIKARPLKLSAAVDSTHKEADTTVYPLSQMTQLLRPDTSTELPALTSVLRTLVSPAFSASSWMFTAGYFNPDPFLTRLLVSTSSSQGTVVTASPWANGFHGSKGISGLLPPAYSLLARRFLEYVQNAGRGENIVLKEWRKGTVGEPYGWTYHAKGLWISMPEGKDPSITIVGSSNYTKRSYSLDLETGTMIITKNEGLKKRLGEEQALLQEHAKVVGIDDFANVERRVSWKVRVAMWIVKMVGGAL